MVKKKSVFRTQNLVSTAILLTIGHGLATAASVLTLTVSGPAKIVDGEPLRFHVTLANVSTHTVQISNLEQTDFEPIVTTHQKFDSQKPVLYGLGTTAPNEIVALSPGGAITTEVDALWPYPFGLSPGRYDVALRYSAANIVSNRVPVEIHASNHPAYSAFVSVAKAAQQEDPAASRLALEFAEAYPSYVYTEPLLRSLIWRSGGEDGLKLVSFAANRYHGTELGRGAEKQLDVLRRTMTSAAEYEKYLQQYQRELNAPENEDAAAAARHLGTIITPNDFVAYEDFLQRFPKSFFAAEALNAMVVAVRRGILPPAATSAESDRVLLNLYRRLLSHPENYWARKAAADPFVRDRLRNHPSE